jgi:integrase
MNNTQISLKKTIKKMDGAYASSTIRAYKEDFGKLSSFCQKLQKSSLPCHPNSLIKFIELLTSENLTSASIRRAIAGISTIHRLNKMIDPSKDSDVILAMRRMHRQLGRASKQAEPITSDRLKQMIKAADHSISGLRDKALLMVAYDTMCRRSELVSLMVGDIALTNHKGATHASILLRKSKTDCERNGRYLHIQKETWKTLQAWINKANLQDGYLFRGITKNGDICEDLKVAQINRIYKRLAKAAKVDEKTVKKISGHSLRVGAAQDLALKGLSLPMIMTKGRWSKTDTVMRYIERISSNY